MFESVWGVDQLWSAMEERDGEQELASRIYTPEVPIVTIARCEETTGSRILLSFQL